MNSQIQLLEAVKKALPPDIFEQEICKRIHHNQMKIILNELNDGIKKWAEKQIRYECYILQDLYDDDAYGLYLPVLYNLTYYISLGSKNDHVSHLECLEIAAFLL